MIPANIIELGRVKNVIEVQLSKVPRIIDNSNMTEFQEWIIVEIMKKSEVSFLLVWNQAVGNITTNFPPFETTKGVLISPAQLCANPNAFVTFETEYPDFATEDYENLTVKFIDSLSSALDSDLLPWAPNSFDGFKSNLSAFLLEYLNEITAVEYLVYLAEQAGQSLFLSSDTSIEIIHARIILKTFWKII